MVTVTIREQLELVRVKSAGVNTKHKDASLRAVSKRYQLLEVKTMATVIIREQLGLVRASEPKHRTHGVVSDTITGVKTMGQLPSESSWGWRESRSSQGHAPESAGVNTKHKDASLRAGSKRYQLLKVKTMATVTIREQLGLERVKVKPRLRWSLMMASS
ncbi:hypothetical protein J6590_011992 [Homalodisca vitripennis]|nr:hypothetical protein J6590_011992 [Homalodisca vitripennis]